MPRGVKGSGPAKRESAIVPAPSAASADALPPSNSNWKPLGSVDVASLSGDALKAYARRAGIKEADIGFLTEDRLRQNIKIAIVNHFELLSE
jgi:hypothetical protein